MEVSGSLFHPKAELNTEQKLKDRQNSEARFRGVD
jgi:hypothetical protein